jgi:hypothetical protein
VGELAPAGAVSPNYGQGSASNAPPTCCQSSVGGSGARSVQRTRRRRRDAPAQPPPPPVPCTSATPYSTQATHSANNFLTIHLTFAANAANYFSPAQIALDSKGGSRRKPHSSHFYYFLPRQSYARTTNYTAT